MASPYKSVVGPSANFAGVDQGIDFTAQSPFDIYALGPGVITRYVGSGSGWPGASGPGTGAVLNYHLTGGPQAGKNVYVAESFQAAPGLRVGSVIKSGQVIGTAPGPYPGIETGFSSASGQAFGSPTGGPQPMGNAFQDFVLGITPSTTTGTGSPGRISVTNPNPPGVPGAGVATGVASGIGDAVGSVSSVADAVKWPFEHNRLLRFGEIVVGLILGILGILMLTKGLTFAGAAGAAVKAAR